MEKIKTRICQKWLNNLLTNKDIKTCIYEDIKKKNCDFVHGIDDKYLDSKYKCKNKDKCENKSCKFIHENIWYIENMQKRNERNTKTMSLDIKNIKYLSITNNIDKETAKSPIKFDGTYENNGRTYIKFISESNPNTPLSIEFST